jgi:hypothetical protein
VALGDRVVGDPVALLEDEHVDTALGQPPGERRARGAGTHHEDVGDLRHAWR